MRDILVRPHNNNTSFITINTPNIIDIGAAFEIGAEHLFIVAQAEPAFYGHEHCRHGLDRQIAMRLLENGTQIDDGIDIAVRWCVFPDW